MGCHRSQIVPGTFKKAYRHPYSANVFTIDSQGYSVLWYEGPQDEKARID
jgi:hypothetical protein